MADTQPTGQEGVNVQVLLRCRPLSDKEVVERTPSVVSVNEASKELTLFMNAGGKQLSKTYRFDRVFGPDSQQERLYKQAIVPIVNEVMDGFNCTIFAYGQTGTGKTFTMEGGPRESSDGRNLSAAAGVIPRSIKQIFDTIEASNADANVKVTFLELYNEELTDLLSCATDAASAPDAVKLRLLEDRAGVVVNGLEELRLLEDRAGTVVNGLEEVIVRSAAEIYAVLDKGTAKRRTAATLLNQRSSRSHSIFTITIHLKETTPEGEDVIKIGKLNLVDLAGSENISRSGARDTRAREAGSINQSLLTLGRVISALVEHSGHIPYRDSKLTRLLRDSLGGRTKTCIIATIAPTVQCQEETVSTLDYAHRAKNIRNKPEVNAKVSKVSLIKDLAAEIERLQSPHIKSLAAEIERLRNQVDLMSSREKNGVFLSNERYQQSDVAKNGVLLSNERCQQGEMERLQLRESLKGKLAELEAAELTHAAEVEASKLAHEAEALGNELTTTAADLEQLFAKFGEVAELHKGDRAVLQGLRAYVAQRMDATRTFAADASDAQAALWRGVGEKAGELGARAAKDAEAARGQVDASRTAVTALRSAASSGLAAVAAAGGSALSAVLTVGTETAAGAGASLGMASEAAQLDGGAKEAEAAAAAAAAALADSARASQQALAAQLGTLLAEYAEGASAGLRSAAASLGQSTAAAETQLRTAADESARSDAALGEGLDAVAAAASKGVAPVMLQLSAAHEITQVSSGALSSLADFKALVASGVAETAGAVSREVAGRAAKESAAPAPVRRPISTPSDGHVEGLMCPPEEVVLQQYRRQRAHVLGAGGKFQPASLLADSPAAGVCATASAAAPRLPDGVNGRQGGAQQAQAQQALQATPSDEYGSEEEEEDEEDAENDSPMDADDDAMEDVAAASAAAHVAPSKAAPGGGKQAGGGVRSKIPGFGVAAGSPARAGLADRTNIQRTLKNLVRKPDADARQQLVALGVIKELYAEDPDTLSVLAAVGVIPPLVQLLGPASSGGVQRLATGILGALAGCVEYAAIPLLVKLLAPDSGDDVQAGAAAALHRLAGNAANQFAIAAAGAIPPLVELLGRGSSAVAQQWAAAALWRITENADNLLTIAAASAIPPLVQLLGPGCSSSTQEAAAGVLCYLAQCADNHVAIIASGAVPPLVELLGPGSDAAVQEVAVAALAGLVGNAESAATVITAGAIPLLAQLMAPGCAADVKEMASLTLSLLGQSIAASVAAAGMVGALQGMNIS
ncbi:hypothetical protein FOA52_008043 [Chlamydomonas sp. UWO 241]|nr:hypothetical protein FOA52_008043 [Chlamydomonas sp. UWO 241]